MVPSFQMWCVCLRLYFTRYVLSCYGHLKFVGHRDGHLSLFPDDPTFIDMNANLLTFTESRKSCKDELTLKKNDGPPAAQSSPALYPHLNYWEWLLQCPGPSLSSGMYSNTLSAVLLTDTGPCQSNSVALVELKWSLLLLLLLQTRHKDILHAAVCSTIDLSCSPL